MALDSQQAITFMLKSVLESIVNPSATFTAAQGLWRTISAADSSTSRRALYSTGDSPTSRRALFSTDVATNGVSSGIEHDNSQAIPVLTVLITPPSVMTYSASENLMF